MGMKINISNDIPPSGQNVICMFRGSSATEGFAAGKPCDVLH